MTVDDDSKIGEKQARRLRLLIVFAKTPIAGQVKTRIGKVVGMEQAAIIYEGMLSTILTQTGTNDIWQQVIAITPESDETYFKCRGLEVIRQSGTDIGQRMSNALSQGFHCGASQVILIGSDIPTLNGADIADAFSLLDSAPAVIGPSGDGGFYLLGITKDCADVASTVLQGEIQWSTSQVLSEVQVFCQSYNLPLSYLPMKRDIDTYEDWQSYMAEQRRKS